MKKRINTIILIIFMPLFLFNSLIFAEDDKTKSKQKKIIDELIGESIGNANEILNSAKLEKVELRYIEGANQENIDKLMSTFHPKAGNCNGTFDREHLLEFFKNKDHKYNLLSFELIDLDKETAIVRVKHHVKFIKPKAPSGNLEFIHIFKKDSGKWKIWQITPLSHNENEKDIE